MPAALSVKLASLSGVMISSNILKPTLAEVRPLSDNTTVCFAFLINCPRIKYIPASTETAVPVLDAFSVWVVAQATPDAYEVVCVIVVSAVIFSPSENEIVELSPPAA